MINAVIYARYSSHNQIECSIEGQLEECKRFAELSKLSSRYITDVERGIHCPTIPKLENISKALNIEPYQLFINIDRDEEIINKIKSGRQYNQK